MYAMDIEGLIEKEELKAREVLDSQIDKLRDESESLWFLSRLQTCQDLLFAIKQKQTEENIQWVDLSKFSAGNS